MAQISHFIQDVTTYISTGLRNRLGRPMHSSIMTRFWFRAAMRPDKKSVTDEVWSDDRVREFLEPAPGADGDHPDFRLLLRAYRSMRPEDFERYIGFFVAGGHDVHARNEEGETFAQHVCVHRLAEPFIATIERAGGKPQ
jgi:hypothetical protein